MLDRRALQAKMMHELHAELSHRTAVNTTSGPRSSYFMYQGDNILAEYTDKTIDAVGGWSSASAVYTQGAGTDQPFLRTEWSSAGAGTNPSSRQFYHQDGLGSVIASTDQSGTNTARQRFDAWGNPIASSGTAISQYGYTGREPDATGLMYYRARYYSPDLGRFTQRDPIGLAGGVNMFGYVDGNPVNFTDPSGLSKFDPFFGLPSMFWNWFHSLDGGKVINALKDGKNVPEDVALDYYKEWIAAGKPNPRNGEKGFVDPSLLEALIPWGLTPSTLAPGTLWGPGTPYPTMADFQNRNSCPR
jgi:RHS repeat-associated protein